MTEKWGRLLLIGKDFRNDPGIDVDEYLRNDFDESLPDGRRRVGELTVEWIDGDDMEAVAARLDREMYLELGRLPPRNLWYVRVEAQVEAAP